MFLFFWPFFFFLTPAPLHISLVSSATGRGRHSERYPPNLALIEPAALREGEDSFFFSIFEVRAFANLLI